MDIVNAALTFFPSAAVVYSIASRVIAHHRQTRSVISFDQRVRRLPVHIMYRLRVVLTEIEPVRNDREPVEPVVVRAHQNQVEPLEPVKIEPLRDLQLNRLSHAAEIALLATQRNADGTYRHSANAITKLMGGTAADVKNQIAEIRATKAERPAERVSRPAKGWGK